MTCRQSICQRTPVRVLIAVFLSVERVFTLDQSPGSSPLPCPARREEGLIHRDNEVVKEGFTPVFTSFTVPAFAAGQQAHDHAHQATSKPAVSPAFSTMDKNKDGFLSKAELAKHPMAGHFDMMDANKDGKLSPREFASM